MASDDEADDTIEVSNDLVNTVHERLNDVTPTEITRRQAIMAMVAAGIGSFGVGHASAAASTSDSDGDIGTPSNRIDAFVDGLSMVSIEEPVHTDTVAVSSYSVDFTDGSVQKLTMDSASVSSPSIGFTGGSTATGANSTTVIAVQDGSGGVDYSFAGVLWPGGSGPSPSTSANAIDIYTFVYDGSNTYGFTGGQAFA